MSDYATHLVQLKRRVTALSDAMRNKDLVKADRCIAESKMYLALMRGCIHRLEQDRQP